jgi:hypothetical protein
MASGRYLDPPGGSGLQRLDRQEGRLLPSLEGVEVND